MVDPLLSTVGWLDVFAQVRTALRTARSEPVPDRPAIEDHYAGHYLTPAGRPRQPGDLRHPDRIRVVVVPERMETGSPSATAYLRLLQPLDHLALTIPLDIVLADPEAALHCQADAIITQRHAIPDTATADALARHVRETGSVLLYDVDEDPPRHRADPRSDAAVMRRMLRHAHRVSVPTANLAASLAGSASGIIQVLPDGLDERLWCDQPRPRPSHAGVVRLLLIGLGMPDADLGLVLPALQRVKQEYGGWVAIESIGLSNAVGLPPWVTVTQMPLLATASYPGFVHWVTRQPAWDIGLAPMTEDAYNHARSGVTALSYAALGMAVVASDVAAYRATLADGPGGMLVGPDPGAWYAAINWLIRNPTLRARLASGAREAFLATGTLAAQATMRREVWEGTIGERMTHGSLPAMAGPGSGHGRPRGKLERAAKASRPGRSDSRVKARP
jgi:glycosyltransferase involved in cell wall biosynthesis